MIFEICRSSEPYNDSSVKQPHQMAELITLPTGTTLWCVKIDSLDDLASLYDNCSVIVSKHSQNAPYINGAIEIYDSWRE